MILVCPVVILLLFSIHGVCSNGLIEVFRWKQIAYETQQTSVSNGGDFVFPEYSRGKRQKSVNSDSTSESDYIPYNNVPMGVTHYNGRLFITIPRRRVGIPSTLNYIDLKYNSADMSPKLRAYPNRKINQLDDNLQPNSQRIMSVYRTRLDACNRLWFIDTGVLEYPGDTRQIQQPSIWILDLETNELVRRFEIPSSILTAGNGLASITVDVDSQSCDNAYAYIPDLLNYALYVYRLRDNHIYTFHHNFFYFDPLQGDLNIGGQSFQWSDGIFSITLSNKNKDGYRTAFFHPMASTSEFAVSTRVLKNETASSRSYHGKDFIQLGTRGPNSQSTMHDFDPQTGIILYDEISRNGVGCWNSNKEFSEANHGNVQQDPRKMIYPSDLTIDNEGTVWVMTNSMPIFIYSNLDPNQFNFRVWKQSVLSAVENTPCSPTNRQNYMVYK